MPLTEAGSKVLANMQKEYGAKKGKSVFYASLNKGTLKRSKMEGKSAPSRADKMYPKKG